MDLNANTKIDDLLQEYPFLMEYLVERSPKFKLLESAVMRKTVGKVATVAQAAAIGGIDPGRLLNDIAEEIRKRIGTDAAVGAAKEGGSPIMDADARQEVLKDIMRDLHGGVEMNILKRKFHELIKDIDPSEIAKMEQRLMDEGMPESEVKRLCDVHVEVFKESLSAQDAPVVPRGHPVHTYMIENRAAEGILHELDHVLAKIGDSPDKARFAKDQPALTTIVGRLSGIDLHYLRKENQLFPVLEVHGITGPSQVMWALHDDIRVALKSATAGVSKALAPDVVNTLRYLSKSIRDMIYKEEHILFPMAIGLLTDAEWQKVRQGEEEIGYAWITPEAGWTGGAGAAPEPVSAGPGMVRLDTGQMTMEQVNMMLKHMPVDISFVDENDEVRYYSATKDRIFPRSPGVIGRKVQNCHPPKSFAMVQRILDEFRAGSRHKADFWIQMKGRFLLIQYFAVRDEKGTYKGTLEVSQDVTDIRKLEGQKRLLDWE
ncbi:MAG: DUF438 domain-containing protein [Nitrospirota bacterium]